MFKRSLLLGIALGSSMALFSAGVWAQDYPCSISRVIKMRDGVALLFSQMNWKFRNSNGDAGILGSGKVVLFERGGSELKQFIEQPVLKVHVGESVRLSDHHSGCKLHLLREDDEFVLKATGGFSYLGTTTSFDKSLRL